MHFSLKQLQHLVLLADERHFARAADRAALSQSAFSRSIQALEGGLRMRLFDRDVKNVRPTPVGERVIERARALLASTGDLARELSLLQSGDLGDVVVGAGALAGATILPGPLVRLRRTHPGVRVDVDVIESSAMLDKLLRAGLDFFVGEYTKLPRNDELRVEPLGRLQVRFYCRAAHPLAAQATASLDDLSRYRLASVHIPDEVLRTLLARLGIGRRATPELSLQCGNLSILRDYVLGTDAILLASERPIKVELEQGLLVPLSVRELARSEAGAATVADLGLVYLAGRTPTPAGWLLMDMIRDEARTRLARPPRQRAARGRASV
jgi:DNA-binding transcriptional LysR family regulator